jgi:hypothetical protein
MYKASAVASKARNSYVAELRCIGNILLIKWVNEAVKTVSNKSYVHCDVWQNMNAGSNLFIRFISELKLIRWVEQLR